MQLKATLLFSKPFTAFRERFPSEIESPEYVNISNRKNCHKRTAVQGRKQFGEELNYSLPPEAVCFGL